MACAGAANAQTDIYPSRAVTIIVPFPAGGPTDTVARIMGDRMNDVLGQPIIVENVTGAGSTIGTTRAVRAKPDGYTLIVGNWTSSVGAGALYPVSWHIVDDLEPIARLSVSSLMIVGKSGLPAKDIKELISWLKENPGKVSAANVGAGSGAHVCYLYIQQKTGAVVQLVPYRGGAPALQDLIAGHVDLWCAEASQTLSAVRAGQIKAYAVMSEGRWAPLPDVPAMQEIGLDLQLAFWHGLWAPKGTSKEIVAKLNAAVVAAFKDPAIQKRIVDLGQTIPPADQLTPEALGAYHRAEIDKWWPFIKAANIKMN